MTKCLVVDDVEVTRFTSEEYLKNLGVESVCVSDGDKALSALRSSNFDVIMLDWHLGKDSGLDTLKTIRKEFGRNLPVIVFSGVENQSKSSAAIEAGANVFLEKPTTQEKLREALKGLGIPVKAAH